MTERKNILKQIDFFRFLSDADLEELSHQLAEIDYPADTIIFEEGSNSDCLYIIISGVIAIYKKFPDNIRCHYASKARSSTIVLDGKTYHIPLSDIIEIMHPYSYFGEMGFFENGQRIVESKSITPCKFLVFKKSQFSEIVKKEPAVELQLLQTNYARIKSVNQHYVETIDNWLAEKRLADIGAAVSKIVHDITTPLSIIMLQSEMISRLYPESKVFTDKISKQTNFINELVSEILDFVKCKKSSLKLSKTTSDDVIKSVLESIEYMTVSKQIKFIVEHRKVCVLEIDTQKIERVILNLLRNAIEASSEGGIIYITSDEIDFQWVLTIRDMGTGILFENIEDVFIPFISSGKETGTGLGLSICKKCIEDHNGSLSADNHSEGGAVFTMRLTIRK
jgi:signal transduction histidine kinase